MRSTILFFLLFITFVTNAQYLHTPTEIENIKKQSAISYQHDSIVPTSMLPSLAVLTFSYEALLLPDASAIDQTLIQTDDKSKKSLKKADNFYLNNKYKHALGFYSKSDQLQLIPEVMIRMADCYLKLQLPDNAISLYQSLLETDSSNAFLYFQLANCFRQKGDYKTACHQITLAHLYNRNNAVYLDSLTNMYREINWRFRELDFNPKYELSQTKDSLIHIYAATKPWVAYASCKAIWSYEPGYREKMNYISSVDSRIIEEKECLFNALLVFERLEVRDKINYPGLYTLSHALPDKRVDDFIMYEISSRNHPEIIRQLSRERVAQLVDYVFTYRVKKVGVSQ